MAKETRKKMLKRLKALRRENHIGEYSRAKVSHARKSKNSAVMSMAKRKSSRKSTIMGGNMMGYIVGGFAFGLVETPLKSMVSKFAGNIGGTYGVPIVEGLALWFIAKKTSGVISQTAKVGLAIVAYDLAKNVNIGGIVSSSSSTGNSNIY